MCVNMSGDWQEYFSVFRSLRQGDSLSPLHFVHNDMNHLFIIQHMISFELLVGVFFFLDGVGVLLGHIELYTVRGIFVLKLESSTIAN